MDVVEKRIEDMVLDVAEKIKEEGRIFTKIEFLYHVGSLYPDKVSRSVFVYFEDGSRKRVVLFGVRMKSLLKKLDRTVSVFVRKKFFGVENKVVVLERNNVVVRIVLF